MNDETSQAASINYATLIKKLMSQSGIYGIAIIFARLGSLLLLPFLWQKLTVADFGVVGLFQLVVIFLMPALGLGFQDSVQRHYHEWSDQKRPYFIGGVWLLTLLFSLSITVILALFGQVLISKLLTQLPWQPYFLMALLTGFFNNLSLIPLSIMRATERVTLFAVVTISIFMTQLVLIIVFLFYLDWGLFGYLLSLTAAAGLWSLFFIGFMLRRITLTLRWRYLAPNIAYALPLVPSVILENVGSLFDRFVLDKFVSLDAIGIYTVANQLGNTVTTFNQVLKTAYVPLIIKAVLDEETGKQVLGRLSQYYMGVMAIVTLFLYAFLGDLVALFADENYASVISLLPFFLFSYYIHSIGAAIGRGIELAKKTIYSPIVPLTSITVSVSALFLLVPSYGIWGAATALVMSISARVIMQCGLSIYFYPRPLYMRHFLATNCLLMIGVLLSSLVAMDHLFAQFGVKLLLCGLISLLIALSLPNALHYVRVVFSRITQ